MRRINNAVFGVIMVASIALNINVAVFQNKEPSPFNLVLVGIAFLCLAWLGLRAVWLLLKELDL